jgi:hypothetical protein
VLPGLKSGRALVKKKKKKKKEEEEEEEEKKKKKKKNGEFVELCVAGKSHSPRRENFHRLECFDIENESY